MNPKHLHNKLKICVSGAADTGHCGPNALDQAKELGRQIVRQGAVLVTGATTGFPLWAAMGAKEEQGISIGLSPASSEREHVEIYKLPLDYLDIVIYTGFGYSGRNLLMTRSADALIIGCGRVGPVNEFTIAFEDGKPIGVLESDAWETDEVLRDIMAKGHRTRENIIFNPDPTEMVKQMIVLIEAAKVNDYQAYKNPNLDQPNLADGSFGPKVVL